MEKQQTEMLLTGKEGEEFDLKTAIIWTKNHREKNPGEPISHFFGKDILMKILEQDGCQGIRIYHAYSDEDVKHVIITGAASNGKDQLPEPVSREELKGVTTHKRFMIGEMSSPCPGSPGCQKSALSGHHTL